MTYPPTFTAEQVEASKRRELATGVGLGAVLVLARIIGPLLPVFHGHSLSEGNSYCTGAVGLLVRGLGGAQVDQACSSIAHWMLALNLGAAGGAILAIACGIALVTRRAGT